MVYRESFNAAVFIKFMEQLIKDTTDQDTKPKIILIVDNLRIHHCKPVKAWVVKHSHKIEIASLPSYSPEHNPDEYLNCDLQSA